VQLRLGELVPDRRSGIVVEAQARVKSAVHRHDGSSSQPRLRIARNRPDSRSGTWPFGVDDNWLFLEFGPSKRVAHAQVAGG
jgi:hypothetical protein